MATLTIRNVPTGVVSSLKTLAKKHHRSMEQEIRELLTQHAADRKSVLDQIEAAWSRQTRRPNAGEVSEWIAAGRE